VKVLALDSSGLVVTLSVADGRRILAESQFEAGGKTVGLLAPEIEKILAEAGIGVQNLDGFALGAGPGSFTGLKVGFAAVLGLAFDSDKPIWTYPSLQLTALGLAASAEFKKGLAAPAAGEAVAFKTGPGGMNIGFGKGTPSKEKAARDKILVLTGAKKGYLYRGMYAVGENGVEETGPLEAQKIEELNWPEEPVWLTGSALLSDRASVMARVRPSDRTAAEDFWHPPAGLLAQMAATGKLGNPVGKKKPLEPIFLKSFETKFREMSQ
jgi:tRNA threonylcarbamoyl adenosine modification protein YeaZ